LIVDNEPAVLRIMQRSLQRYGFSVVTAVGAEEALAMCWDSTAISAVVTDVEMELGRMNGLQLAASLRAKNPGLPILVVSGSRAAELDARERGLPFLAKPFKPVQLATMVNALQPRVAPAG
jgi:CheY-like chemotaxis protein